MDRKGIMVVISGFSGAGKGTLMKRLLEKYPEQYALSVSMTTRSPRPGEQDGIHYYFVNKETFETEIAKDGFVEYATYCDNYYGTPRKYVEQVLDSGRDVILEIEIQGSMKVKERFPQALLLFVMPPTAVELERRLRARGTETEEVIHQRMSRAVEESEGIGVYDSIVINDDLEVCVEQLHQIIEAAHAATNRNENFILQMQEQLKDLLKGE